MSEIYFVIEKHRFEYDNGKNPHLFAMIRKISMAIYKRNRAVTIKSYNHSRYVYVVNFVANELDELEANQVRIQNINDNGYTLMIDTELLDVSIIY